MRLTFPTSILTGLVLAGLAIAFVDRPLSTWSHDHLHGLAIFVWLTWIAEPMVPTAMVGLVGAGIAALAGWRPGRWGRALIAVCVATLVAVAIKDQLKFAFGRTWPETWTGGNPAWIGGGVFGFFPFHGGQGWASFPSGHTTVIAAPMSALGRALGRGRWLCALPVVLVALGLIGADYHWLSDTLAGATLGLATGWGIWAVMAANERPRC